MPVFEAGPHRFIPGHVHGRRQPSLLVSLRLHEGWRRAWHRTAVTGRAEGLLQAWREATEAGLARHLPADPATGWPDWVQGLGACAVALLQETGLAVFENVLLLRIPEAGARRAGWTTLLLPVQPGRPAATLQAWQLTLQAFERGLRPDGDISASRLVQDALHALMQWGEQGTNTPRLLRAAYDSGIPVTVLGPQIFQYGQGRKAQWLESTITLQTPNISTRLARDKPGAAARLRQAGLPVPAHRLVAEAGEAVRVAQQLG